MYEDEDLENEPKWKSLPDANGNFRSRKRNNSAPSIDGVMDKLSEDGREYEKTERPPGIKTQKAARSQETSSQRMADAAIKMARTLKRKAELEGNGSRC
ncbi:hypothetical protein PHMEG_0009339 [Phytophthora megakarya]|uniref:Uncharacterized protein n=1 Tax=Phytophthora megakarya TaxID=4795 RepID=A0A225WI76_9STRA|nr:hypothetical protein PHMEG_0009339 [Phytophthora megakarya]